MEIGLKIGILIMLSFSTFYWAIGVKILEDILLEIRKIRFLKENRYMENAFGKCDKTYKKSLEKCERK